MYCQTTFFYLLFLVLYKLLFIIIFIEKCLSFCLFPYIRLYLFVQFPDIWPFDLLEKRIYSLIYFCPLMEDF